MKRIAVINQKGGVGKTTTAVNLAAAWADAGQSVCLLDLDPQAHASAHLGLIPNAERPSMYDVLVRGRRLQEVRTNVLPGLDLVGSDLNLAGAEIELAGVVGREMILRDALAADDHSAPTIVMDCAPSLGVLTLNALAAATEVVIPLQPQYFALHGLERLLETTAIVARRINPALRVTAVVACQYDGQVRLTHEVLNEVVEFLERSRGRNLPWSEARLLNTRVRRNIRLAECPSFGQTIFQYAPKSNGAEDYRALALEFAEQPALAAAA